MNVLEIDESIDDIKKAVGFSVQSVSFYNKTLVLGLWHEHISYSLILSVRFGQQGIYLIPEKNKFKSEKKPILLFGSTHLKNSRLVDIIRDQKAGRQVELFFTSDSSEDLKIIITLIPSVLNISILNGPKVVHYQKPKPLPESGEVDLSQLKIRDLEALKEVWASEFRSSSLSKGAKTDKKDKVSKNKKTREQEIKKKKKALVKVESDLKQKMDNDYFEFASLVSENPEQAKIKFPVYFDKKISVYKLKDLYFEKHKAMLVKQDRIKSRIKNLKKELKSLESITDEQWQSLQPKSGALEVLFKHPIKTRKLQVASDLTAYIGKSAQDNLKLLRSAKSWHLWLHIKDLPSAHIVLFKDKARVVSDQEIQSACLWLLSESKPGESKGLGHGTIEVIATECRYVRPIKGDKLGRVNYTHEKVYSVRLPALSL